MGYKLIRVNGLKKVFHQDGGELLVLDNLSFDVEEGSFTTLLGPSGCGKSTLLNILTGLEDLSAGTIEISSTGSLVPIPSAFWLLGSGLIAFAGVRRKLRK